MKMRAVPSIPSSGVEFYMASVQEEALQESPARNTVRVTPDNPAAASNGILASSNIIDLIEKDSRQSLHISKNLLTFTKYISI